MTLSEQELMEVAVVVGTHGLRGDLKVRPLPTAEGALSGVRELFLKGTDGQFKAHPVRRCSPHKANILVRLEGYEHIDSATSLVGQSLYLPLDELPELSSEHNYWHQLEGLTVVDRQRGPLGTVVEMFTTAAHDILVVRSDQGEVLIPAIPPFLIEVDSEAEKLLVDLPEGLVPFIDEI
jgi:16S rRNA processing protein RimM